MVKSKIATGFVLVLLIQIPALGATKVRLYQKDESPSKRKGSSPVPEILPGTVGFPGAPAQDPDRGKQAEKTRQLQELYQKRLQARSGKETETLGAKPQSPGAAKAVNASSQPSNSDQGTKPPSPPKAPSAPATAPASNEKVAVSSKGISLRFTEAPIQTVISSVMKELGYSYVIDPQVSGSVSLYTAREVPKARLFGLLEQLLKMNGHAIIKQEDLYIIVPLNQGPKNPHHVLMKPQAPAKEQDPKSEVGSQTAQPQERPEAAASGPEASTSASPASQEQETPASTEEEESGEPGPVALQVPGPTVEEQLSQEQGVITYIIPLHYIPSSEMVKMIQPFASDGATIIDFVSSNMIIVNDYRQNIEQVLNLINLIDTRYFDINTVDLVPIRYGKAEDVANDLGTVFAAGEEAAGIRIVAIERLNSILVVTRSPAVFQEVTDWIDKLDTPSTSTNVKTFVYQVGNNTAMNIAEVLAQLYEDGLPTDQGRPEREGEEGPAQRPPSQPREQDPRGRLGAGQSGFQGAFGGGALGPSLGGRSQQGIRAVVSGNIKIIVNEFNNSLIVQGTESDYQFLLETIKQLDVLPRQVLIEVKIYSVELRDDLRFGVAAFLEERGGGGDPELTSSSVPTTGQISTGGALTIMSRAFIGAERQLEGIITALRSRTNVEILEAPRLLALDGIQAQINVGAEVPVTTASFGDPLRSGTSTSFINSIQFRPTGVTVMILPRISASGVVRLDLALEVSSATGATLTPTINRNYIQTSLIVKDGQTVAIAGIISDHLDWGKKRVPVLGDIPILGVLFGQTTRNSRRSELIFFITPHVVRNLPTATELTLDFKRALRNAYDLIHRKQGAEDQLIEQRREKELRENP